MEAHIWIVGRVGTDPDVRIPQEGLLFTSFRLASTPVYMEAGSWKERPTTWIKVECGGLLAKNVSLCVRKGQQVIVGGKLRTDRWTDDKGVEQERTFIYATVIGHDLNRMQARVLETRARTPESDEAEEPLSAAVGATVDAEAAAAQVLDEAGAVLAEAASELVAPF
ncbi:MAG: single-stranded DNA-binding protein [Propionibacteriaceae bacterium]|jgi:single-strand DNA-binding protein|nr:single-stranded DNA-binding protein [Propionibacteriaceae bacterium]